MRIWAITKRVLKQLLRDKRTLALMFIAPLVVLALMSYIFSVNMTSNVTIGTVGVSQTLQKDLNKVQHVKVKAYSSKQKAQTALKNEQVDSTLEKRHNNFYATYANTDSSKTKLAKTALQTVLKQEKMNGLIQQFKQVQQKLPATAAQQQPKTKQTTPKIHNDYRYGNGNSTFFAKLMPILMGFFVFFFVFLISGMALLSERTSGTLERLLVTPVRRSDIIYGYMLSYGLIAVIQTLLIVIFTVTVLNVQVLGSLWLVLLITILLALVALSLGIFTSTFAKSEFQMIQFIPIIVIPQIFFSGIIPLESMANWAQWLADVLPMKYAADALTAVIMKDATFTQIAGDLLALLIFIIVLTAGNIWGLRRYRKV
ncbi:ABC transporter permease [Bombilactobacillus thymidiniphilus]|uniref:ABC transporter permease n=1 Tax=Bombilactobacillus thymidiniphilus TaxID=2923363 RepID=A0ABY4PC72_9LACO|nr:ABC transporter permease [Bombilactobacillus thymidiniphilus]UQS83359.1 ABC transporter permease [Bombilactobacillus thymidiniphilus]